MGPFDGLCAADAGDNRNVFTTPVADWIPEFPRILGQEVVTYTDGLWGPQEYTRWPQLYNEKCIHHACIPLPNTPFAPSSQVYKGLRFQAWQSSPESGVSQFGSLCDDVLSELRETAASTIERYDAAYHQASTPTTLVDFVLSEGAKGPDPRLGAVLSLLLRNTVDHLSVLSTTEQHALVVARMAHRLILELSGLTVYYHTVAGRIQSTQSTPYVSIPVLGAFIRSASAAQLFFRIGIPFWYIQPWTSRLVVQKIVQPLAWSTELSDEPSWPRVPKSWYDPDGTHQDPSRWTQASVVFICNQLSAVSLPTLLPLKHSADQEREAKRFKGDDAAVPLGPSVSTSNHTRSSSKRGKRARGKKAGAQSRDPHPATTFMPPPSGLVRVTPSWEAALNKVSPLPNPPPVAAQYYFPPPFLIWNAPETNKWRYVHNYARLHQFCRQRLVDQHINGSPLRITDWRHALYGDYRLDDPQPTIPVDTPQNHDVASTKKDHSYERLQAVRALFARTAGLTSYSGDEQPVYCGLKVSADFARQNKALLARIVWELHELNWRCELHALDSLVVDRRDDAFIKWEQEELIAKVWRVADKESLFSSICAGEPSFRWTPAGEEDWQRRRVNLAAFVSILQLWPQCPAPLRMNAASVETVVLEEYFDEIERVAVEFYVNTFVKHFHRLPSPPVQIRLHI